MDIELIGVRPAAPIGIVGYRAGCDAWAQDAESGSGMVLVSLLGPHTVLLAVWGQLIAGQVIELNDGTILHRPLGLKESEESGSGTTAVRYQRSVARFSDIEQAHLVMIAGTATIQVEPGQRSYLLTAGPLGDPARFFAFWNRTVPIPARRAWSPYLWSEGLNHGVVRPIAAYGSHAWAIEPQAEPWSEIIRKGVVDHKLK